MTVKAGSAMISGWTTSFALPAGGAVPAGWSGTYAQSGSTVTVSNAAWNGLLGSGATTTYGFVGSGTAPGASTAVTLHRRLSRSRRRAGLAHGDPARQPGCPRGGGRLRAASRPARLAPTVDALGP